MTARAAPPVFPLPYHKPLGYSHGGLRVYTVGEQRVCKGWWPVRLQSVLD